LAPADRFVDDDDIECDIERRMEGDDDRKDDATSIATIAAMIMRALRKL
jgi:hypothetical protein